jgi:hypothetical protein
MMAAQAVARLGVGAAYLNLASGKLSISGWERDNLVHLDLPRETLALRGAWLALTGCSLIGATVAGQTMRAKGFTGARALSWLGSMGSGAIVGGTLGTWALRQTPGSENPVLARRQTVVTLALGMGTLLAAHPCSIAGTLFASSGVAGWIGVVYFMPSALPLTPSMGAAHGARARAWLRRRLPRAFQDAVPGWEPYASAEERVARRGTH